MHRLSAIIIITSFLSCGKHEPEPHIPPEPVVADIVFSNPTPNAIFNSGDSIHIVAMAISSDVIHGALIQIGRAGDTAVYTHHIHDHSDTIRINQKWKNSFSVPADIEISITITLDHHGGILRRKLRCRTQ